LTLNILVFGDLAIDKGIGKKLAVQGKVGTSVKYNTSIAIRKKAKPMQNSTPSVEGKIMPDNSG